MPDRFRILLDAVEGFGDREFTHSDLYNAVLNEHEKHPEYGRLDKVTVSSYYNKMIRQAVRYGFIEVVDYFGSHQYRLFKRVRDGESGYYGSKGGEQ